MRRILNVSVLVLVTVFSPCAISSHLAFAGNDTPKDVAKTAAAARRDSQTVKRDSDRFLAMVANDLRFTSRLMETAKGKDKEAIANFIKRAIGARSKITIEDIDTDWCLRIVFTIGDFTVDVKIGTTCRR